MKQYQQAIVLTAVLLFSIIFTSHAPEQASAVLINRPITESSVTLEAIPAFASQMPTRPFVEKGALSDPNEQPPILTINSALAVLIDTNEILYEANAEQHWPLASLTKLMTGVIALEYLPANAPRDEQIKRMMIFSDNTAAKELADELGSPMYIARMNEKAAFLGMRDTGFFDATGLSYLNQSTVRDIGILAAYIQKRHPEIFEWSRLKTIVIGGITYANINRFAERADFLGGKTGFTDEANGNLVSLFKTNKGPIGIIIFGTKDKEERFRQTERILSWLLHHFKL